MTKQNASRNSGVGAMLVARRWTASRTSLLEGARLVLLGFAAMALFSPRISAMEKTAGIKPGASPPINLHLEFGKVALVADPIPAKFGFERAKGQIEDGGDSAGMAAGALLGTRTPDPLLDAVVGAGTLVLAPVKATTAAIGAHKRLGSDKLAACEADLKGAMSAMASQQRFHDWLLKVAEEKCPGRLVAVDLMPPSDWNDSGTEVALQTRVEELRLERTGSGDTSYALRIKARTRLVRTTDCVVLYDQPAEYRSGTSLFLDWTLHDAFERVADTGYRELAEHIVGQLLTTTDRPLLAGAAFKKGPVPKWKAPLTLAGVRPPAPTGSVLRVSYPFGDAPTLGIYSATEVPHVVFERPLTRQEADSEALSDVATSFEGLTDHPNPFIYVPACAAAIPVSLWKQGAAVVRGLSPKTLREAEAKLQAAALQTEPHRELAACVARQLAPQTSQTVMLVKAPLPPGAEEDPALMRCLSRNTLAWLPRGKTAGSYLVTQGAATALEIRVQRAALVGGEGINPKLALCVEAQATFLRSQDGRQLYSIPLRYRSEGRSFTKWAANDARLFREELQKCYSELGTAIAAQLVSNGLLPPPAGRMPATLANN